MKILTISGSSRKDSSNAKLLDALPKLFPEYNIYRNDSIENLPLFKAEEDKYPWAEEVINWRKSLAASEAVIICTPEYIYNLPALIKNALEWIASSGELVGKRVLAMTFTPNLPRGEKTIQSLTWCLQALDANIVAQLPLYQNEVFFNDKNELVENENLEMLREAIRLLVS